MNFRFTAFLLGAVVLGLAILALVTYFDTDKVGTDGLMGPFTKTGLKESDVDTVEILRSEPTEEKLVFAKLGEGRWELRQPVVAKIDPLAVEGIVKMLFKAKPTNYAGLTDNLGQHGLSKPSIRITLKRGSDTTATVSVGDTTIGGSEAHTFVTTAENPDRPIALRTSDLRPLFRESAVGKDGAAWQLAKGLTDFRSRRLLGADIASPDTGIESVTLKRGAATLKLTRTSSGWRFDEPAGLGDADPAGDTISRTDVFTGVRPLLNAILSLQATGVGDYIEGVPPSGWAKYGLDEGDPAVLRVEIKPTGAAPAETLLIGKRVEKDNKPIEPTKVYCRLLGDSAAIVVPSDRIDAIAATIANPAEMRNKDLIDAEKKEMIDAIDIAQGAAKFKLRRIGTGTPAQWAIYGGTPEGRWATYAGPSNAADARASVSQLLDALTKPRAAKAVLSNAAPELFATATASVKVWTNAVTPSASAPGDDPPAEPALKGDPSFEFKLGKVDTDVAYLKRTVAGQTVDYQIPLALVAALMRPRMDYVDPRAGTFAMVNVSRVAFNRGAEAFEIVRAGPPGRGVDPFGRWEFAKPDARKGKGADGATIPQLLQQLAAQQAAKLVTDAPTPDELTRWGLAAPRMKVTVAQEKAPERTYEFGNDTEDKKGVYFRVGGKPFAFAAPKELFDLLAAADLRDRTLFRFDPVKVTRLEITAWKTLSTTGKPSLVKLERQGTTWVALEPKDFPVDQRKVIDLLLALEAPRASEYVPGLTAEMGLDVEAGAFQVLIVSDAPAPALQAGLLKIGKEDAGKTNLYAFGSPFEGVVKIDASKFRSFVEGPASLTSPIQK